MQRFGEKLRKLREKEGLSYRQLAVELEHARSHLARIEAGTSMPSVQLVVKIAEYFEVSFDELMDDEVELD